MEQFYFRVGTGKSGVPNEAAQSIEALLAVATNLLQLPSSV